MTIAVVALCQRRQEDADGVGGGNVAAAKGRVGRIHSISSAPRQARQQQLWTFRCEC